MSTPPSFNSFPIGKQTLAGDLEAYPRDAIAMLEGHVVLFFSHTDRIMLVERPRGVPKTQRDDQITGPSSR